MSCLIQLGGGCQSGGTGTDDSDGLSGSLRWPAGSDDPFLKRTIDDRDFDILDGHRIGIDSQDARSFAGCGAKPACKFGEIVRREEPQQRLLPLIAVNEIVPVRNDIPERTTLVAERDTTIHTP